MHWYISKFMTWLIFFSNFFFHVARTRNHGTLHHTNGRVEKNYEEVCVWEKKRLKRMKRGKNRQNSEWPLMSESKTITARQTGIRMKMNNLYPLNDIRPMLPVKFLWSESRLFPHCQCHRHHHHRHGRRLVSSCYGMIIRAHSTLDLYYPTLSIDGFLLSVGMSW